MQGWCLRTHTSRHEDRIPLGADPDTGGEGFRPLVVQATDEAMVRALYAKHYHVPRSFLANGSMAFRTETRGKSRAQVRQPHILLRVEPA